MSNFQLQTKLILGSLSGALVALGFAPFGYWYLMPIGIAIWWSSIHQRKLNEYISISFIFFIVFWLILINWIIAVGFDAYLGLTLLMALIYSSMSLIMFFLRKSRFAFVWYAFVYLSFDTFLEYLPFGGFPWGKLSYSSVDAFWSKYMPFGGNVSVDLVILLSAALIIYIIQFIINKKYIKSLFIAAPILLIVIATLIYLPKHQNSPKKIIDVAIVQGNVPRTGLNFNEQKEAVFNYHLNETKRFFSTLSDQQIDNLTYVAWPENSIDVDPYKNSNVNNSMQDLVDEYKIKLIAGAVLNNGSNYQNSLIIWQDKKASEEIYSKQKLVPFGEYLPYRNVISKLNSKFSLISSDFIPGKSNSIIDINETKFTPLICFEVAWSDNLNRSVIDGATFISVHTNNATYAFTSQVEQQLEISRIRAKETGKQVIISATTGISAHIDTDGKILWQSDEFVPVSKIVKVTTDNSITFATKYHQIWQNIGLYLIFLPIILELLKRIRLRYKREN